MAYTALVSALRGVAHWLRHLPLVNYNPNKTLLLIRSTKSLL